MGSEINNEWMISLFKHLNAETNELYLCESWDKVNSLMIRFMIRLFGRMHYFARKVAADANRNVNKNEINFKLKLKIGHIWFDQLKTD